MRRWAGYHLTHPITHSGAFISLVTRGRSWPRESLFFWHIFMEWWLCESHCTQCARDTIVIQTRSLCSRELRVWWEMQISHCDVALKVLYDGGDNRYGRGRHNWGLRGMSKNSWREEKARYIQRTVHCSTFWSAKNKKWTVRSVSRSQTRESLEAMVRIGFDLEDSGGPAKEFMQESNLTRFYS